MHMLVCLCRCIHVRMYVHVDKCVCVRNGCVSWTCKVTRQPCKYIYAGDM